MGFVEIIKVSPYELDLCDSCGNQGRIASGHMTNDAHGEPVIFICFNCKQNILK